MVLTDGSHQACFGQLFVILFGEFHEWVRFHFCTPGGARVHHWVREIVIFVH